MSWLSTRNLLKEYKPQNIGIFGTSAGAILTGEVAVKLKQLGYHCLGRLGCFLRWRISALRAIPQNLFTLNGFPGDLCRTPRKHALRRIRAQYRSERSGTVSAVCGFAWHAANIIGNQHARYLAEQHSDFHRALLRAGNDTQLVVYEALPHAFWYHFQLPETQECLELMAKFFDQKLAR